MDISTTADDNLELLNIFLMKYNAKYNSIKNMFDGVNDKDPTSTNDQMELFNQYMFEHNNLIANEGQDYVDIYDQNTFLINTNNYDSYAIIIDDNDNDKKVLYLSYSYISLLWFGYKYLSKKLWNIVKL